MTFYALRHKKTKAFIHDLGEFGINLVKPKNRYGFDIFSYKKSIHEMFSYGYIFISNYKDFNFSSAQVKKSEFEIVNFEMKK